MVSERTDKPWRRRLYLPAYQVSEAARYAQVSPQTVAAWHRTDKRTSLILSSKNQGEALSYLQLIEVAVVAAFRKFGVPLSKIRGMREYISTTLKAEYPFAAYKFKTDGKSLYLGYEQIQGKRGRGKLLEASPKGQLAWDDIIGATLKEFDYKSNLAVRWHVAGSASPIIIDPQIAFGTPIVSGAPTWVIKERWIAGESASDIAYDFGLKQNDVKKALEFEGVNADSDRTRQWIN